MQEGMGCGCGGSEQPGGSRKCGCLHHKVPVLMVLLIGVLFFSKAWGGFSANTVDLVWPILVIVGALTKLCGGGCKCCGMKSGCH